MVFYLKYRPQVLDELDNTRVAQLIGKYLMLDRIPHAFLFTGSKGTGKTSTARILAKSINCLHPKKGQACGKCEACTAISAGQTLDILEIDAASNRGIDEIRDLREKIKLTPVHLKYKVYIIDEVHMLTTEAFNALLKTLEEPPAHAVFVLATTEAHKIPETIISRCVQIDFHKATTSEIVHALKRVALGEKLTIPEDALKAIAAASDGSFRDAKKILEEVVMHGDSVTLDSVTQAVGNVDVVLIADFLEKLRLKKAKELLEFLRKLSESGKSLPHFFLQILRELESLLVATYGDEIIWKREDLVYALKLFTQAYAQLRSAVIEALPFELAVVEYCEEKSPAIVGPKPGLVLPSDQTAAPVLDTSSAAPVTAAWSQILEALKSANHSIVGVLRSCRPISIADDVLTIEAGYKFHADRINDSKVRDLIAKAVKHVVGLDVKIATVLKKR